MDLQFSHLLFPLSTTAPLNLMQWSHKAKIKSYQMIKAIVRTHSTTYLKYHYRFIGPDSYWMLSTIRYSTFASLQWLEREGYYLYEEPHLDDAAYAGDLTIFKYILCKLHISDIYPLTTSSAVGGGSIAILAWLRDNCAVKLKKYLDSAIYKNQLPTYQWLLEQGHPHPFNAADLAASSADVEFVVWLQEQGHTWTSDAYRCAAISDNTSVLDYIYTEDRKTSSGALWNAQIYESVASRGALEGLKWLYTKDCAEIAHIPWNFDSVFTAALKCKNIAVLDFLYDTTKEKQEVVLTLAHMTTVIKERNYEFFLWLRERNCPWNDKIYFSAMTIGVKRFVNYFNAHYPSIAYHL